jgi:hypothetical protein
MIGSFNLRRISRAALRPSIVGIENGDIRMLGIPTGFVVEQIDCRNRQTNDLNFPLVSMF